MLDYLKKMFRSPQLPLTCAGKTDTGKVRDHNEDNFGILKDLDLYMVADGMGGHNAGEVASKIAIDSLIEYFTEDIIYDIRGNKAEIRHCLLSSFQKANEKVIAMSEENNRMEGMGCTLVACMIDDNLVHTCHVGDARCYIANREIIEQITTDHSTIAEYTRRPGNNQNLENRPPRHVVTRVIGYPFPEGPEYHCVPLYPESRVLLCSDGLWSMLDDTELQRILTQAATPEEAAKTLVARANEAGGTDNITALAIFS